MVRIECARVDYSVDFGQTVENGEHELGVALGVVGQANRECVKQHLV